MTAPDELREALVAATIRYNTGAGGWQSVEQFADALLAGPLADLVAERDALRAKDEERRIAREAIEAQQTYQREYLAEQDALRETVRRVEALAEDFDKRAMYGGALVWTRIRAALRGES